MRKYVFFALRVFAVHCVKYCENASQEGPSYEGAGVKSGDPSPISRSAVVALQSHRASLFQMSVMLRCAHSVCGTLCDTAQLLRVHSVLARGPVHAASMASDAAGLFSSEPAGSAAAAAERRTKLRRWDHVAAQALNPQGVSDIDKAGLMVLWSAVSKGNKAVAFFTNPAATQETGGEYRVGVGISQTAQALLAAIGELRKPLYAQLLRDEPLKKALKVADALEPQLKILDAGKGSETGGAERAGFAALRGAAGGAPGPAPTQPQVDAAATALYQFLVAERNDLRGVLSLMSGGGSFYNAAVAEKTARAWVQHKPALLDDVKSRPFDARNWIKSDRA
jgi:hypothetical protein